MTSSEKSAKVKPATQHETVDDVPDDATVIKKYANRRLYNTATSSYVTLSTLCRMVKDGENFVVFDARTGADITRSVLTQIIVEEEAKGRNLLPVGFLRQLIGFYGDSLQMVVPRYLDQTMTTFAEHQDATRSRMQESLGEMFPISQFQEMSSQNMAMFENALKMFTPLVPGDLPQASADVRPESGSDNRSSGVPDDALKSIQDQLNRLQKELQALGDGRSKDSS